MNVRSFDKKNREKKNMSPFQITYGDPIHELSFRECTNPSAIDLKFNFSFSDEM